MRAILIGVSMLALAGCTASEPANSAQNGTAANASAPAFKPWPKLGGVDLGEPIRAAGTEPYWTLDLAPGDMLFTDHSVDSPAPVPFFAVMPKVEGAKAVYATKNEDGAAVVLTLTLEKCLDVGEEKNSQPLTATLRIGGRTLMGCAGPKPEDEPADNATSNVANAQ